MTNTIAITFGRFNLIHTGHAAIFNLVVGLGINDAIIGSNRCDFSHLHQVYNETVTTVRTNSVFSLVQDALDQYGEDTTVYLVLGADQQGLGNAVKRYFPNVQLICLPRDEEAASSTRVRQVYAESTTLDEFTATVMNEGLVDNAGWASELYMRQMTIS